MAEVDKALRRLSKAFDNILIGTAYVSGSLIVLIMLSVSYEVVMRYFFNSPTRWAMDFSGYMQYILVSIGAAWLLMVDGHARIDTFLSRFPPRLQKIINFFTSSMALVACALFFWKGIEATWIAYRNGDILFREVQIPSAPLLAFIPFGFLLLCVQFARRIYPYLRSNEHKMLD